MKGSKYHRISWHTNLLHLGPKISECVCKWMMLASKMLVLSCGYIPPTSAGKFISTCHMFWNVYAPFHMLLSFWPRNSCHVLHGDLCSYWYIHLVAVTAENTLTVEEQGIPTLHFAVCPWLLPKKLYVNIRNETMPSQQCCVGQHSVVLDGVVSFIYDNENSTGCIKIKLFLNSISTYST